MVREYEAMYILRPELDEEGLTKATEWVQSLFVEKSGELVKSTRWGRRHLAYPIEDMNEGIYVIDRFKTDSLQIKSIERLLHMDERVLRHMIVLSSTTTELTLGDGLHGEDQDHLHDDNNEHHGRSRHNDDDDDDDDFIDIDEEE